MKAKFGKAGKRALGIALTLVLIFSVIAVLPGAEDVSYAASKVKPKIKITAVKNNTIDYGGRVTVQGKVTNWAKAKKVKANKKAKLQVRTDTYTYDSSKRKNVYKWQTVKTVKISKKGTFKITSGNINFYGSKRPMRVVVGKATKSASSVNVYGWYDFRGSEPYPIYDLIKSGNVSEARYSNIGPYYGLWSDFRNTFNVEGRKCDKIKIMMTATFDSDDINREIPLNIHVDGLVQNADIYQNTFTNDAKAAYYEGPLPAQTNIIEIATTYDSRFNTYTYVTCKMLAHCLVPVSTK